MSSMYKVDPELNTNSLKYLSVYVTVNWVSLLTGIVLSIHHLVEGFKRAKRAITNIIKIGKQSYNLMN